MALVVESYSSASGNSQPSLTVTKPTGTTEGDLLVIVAHGLYTSGINCTGFTESFFEYADNGSNPHTSLTTLWKIAGASEPASYTVNEDSSTDKLGVVCMLRISGWTAGDPITTTNFDASVQDSATPSMGNTGLALTKADGALMILIGHCMTFDNGAGATSFSGYSITSGESNPSWTEVVDTEGEVWTGLSRYSALAVAYAVTANTSNITAWDITVASSTTGSSDGFHGALLLIKEPTNASGTTALKSVTPSEFSANAVADAIANLPLVQAVKNIFTMSGKGLRNSVFTNLGKSGSGRDYDGSETYDQPTPDSYDTIGEKPNFTNLSKS